MAVSVKPAVEAIWIAMGLVPPPEAIGDRYEFTVEETDFVLRVAANGSTLLLEGTLGQLATDPVEAGDQMRRLLRAGLGLAAFNGAALALPDLNDDSAFSALSDPDREARPSIRVAALAAFPLREASRRAVGALQEVLQWQEFARGILSKAAYAPVGQTSRSGRDDSEPGDFVIFQP